MANLKIFLLLLGLRASSYILLEQSSSQRIVLMLSKGEHIQHLVDFEFDRLTIYICKFFG